MHDQGRKMVRGADIPKLHISAAILYAPNPSVFGAIYKGCSVCFMGDHGESLETQLITF